MFLDIDRSLPNGIDQVYVKDLLSHFNLGKAEIPNSGIDANTFFTIMRKENLKKEEILDYMKANQKKFHWLYIPLLKCLEYRLN